MLDEVKPNATLEESVSSALEKHEGEEATRVAEATPTEITTEKPIEKAAEGEAKPDKTLGLDEVQQAQAMELFAALKDPAKAPAIIEFIAKQGGYTKVETKVEAAEAKDEILDTLKVSLGPELEYLADRLAPAISKIIDGKLKENTADIRQHIAQQEETRLASRAASAMEKLAQEFYGENELPDEVAGEMSKLMDKMPAGENMTAEEYVENIFYTVAGRKGITPNTKAKAERTERNRNDAPSRLASTKGVREPVTTRSPQFKSLDEAVQDAITKAQALAEQ